MKIRQNYGKQNLPSPFCSGLIMEGGRENLIPANPFNSDYCRASIVGAKLLGACQHPKMPEFPVWFFELQPRTTFQIKIEVNCPREYLGYTFSMFATTSANIPIDLRLIFSDGDERKCDNIHVIKELTRFETAHEFATAPKSLSVELRGEIVGEQFSEKPITIGFAFLSIEEGLFASSPIPPGEPRGIRGGEQLSCQREGNFFEHSSGTLSLFFVPGWTGSQLGSEGTVYLLDCVADSFLDSISILADGADYGKLKASIVANGNYQTIETDIIPVCGKIYAIALRWTTDSAELVINGRTVAESVNIQMPDKYKLGHQVYFGSTSRSPNLSAFGKLHHVLAYNDWLSDNVLRAIIFEKYPNVFPQFETDWIELQNRQPILLTSQSWAFDLVQKMLRMQRTWQETPPVWLKQEAIDESNYRDEMHRLLQSFDFNSIREAHSEAGRTDLLVSDKNDTIKMLRMEFKIWGRHDYDQIPEKPLKYFVDGENIAIVVMINPNKNKPINNNYRTNVSSSPTDCVGIINKPFEQEFFPDHFISLHERNNYYAEVLHIILNRYAPFAIK
jgi:hypothetical protein